MCVPCLHACHAKVNRDLPAGYFCLALGSTSHGLALAFAEASRLACAFAEVEQLCSTNATVAFDFDLRDLRCVDRECSFDAFAGNDAADGEHFTGSLTSTSDHNATEDLDAFLVAFKNSSVNVRRCHRR